MSKKKLILILAVIFLVFITAFVLIMCNRKPTAPEIVPDKYAADNYHGYHPSETTVETTLETDANGQPVLQSYTYSEIGESFTYSGIEYVTPEQKPVTDTMFHGIVQYANDFKINGDIQTVEILNTSDEDRTYAKITWADGSTAEFVCPFDRFSLHDYMFHAVVDRDLWESIQNGDYGGHDS